MKKLGEGQAGVLLVKEEMGRRHVVLVRRRVVGAEGGRARTSKGWEAQWEVWTLMEEPLGAGGGGGASPLRRNSGLFAGPPPTTSKASSLAATFTAFE